MVDLSSGLYVSQSGRGELVMGVTMGSDDTREDQVRMDSSPHFLRRVSQAFARLFPDLAAIDVLRQWAGPYDFSPDGDPIVGPSPGLARLVQICGFTGHGFMMAPAVGRIVARWLALGETHPMLERWDPGRFARGDIRRREDMIIG